MMCNAQGMSTPQRPLLQGYVPKQHKLKALVKEILKERMEKQQYDPIKGAQASPRKTTGGLMQFTADQQYDADGFFSVSSMQSILQMTCGKK